VGDHRDGSAPALSHCRNGELSSPRHVLFLFPFLPSTLICDDDLSPRLHALTPDHPLYFHLTTVTVDLFLFSDLAALRDFADPIPGQRRATTRARSRERGRAIPPAQVFRRGLLRGQLLCRGGAWCPTFSISSPEMSAAKTHTPRESRFGRLPTESGSYGLPEISWLM
jgi:hypothetical protein